MDIIFLRFKKKLTLSMISVGVFVNSSTRIPVISNRFEVDSNFSIYIYPDVVGKGML